MLSVIAVASIFVENFLLPSSSAITYIGRNEDNGNKPSSFLLQNFHPPFTAHFNAGVHRDFRVCKIEHAHALTGLSTLDG